MMLALLAACVSPTTNAPRPVTETGNPERDLGVAAFDPTPVDAEDVVDEAWSALGETKFVLDPASAGDEELEWETPEIVADLAAGPVDLRFRSPNLAYSRVELRPREGRDLPADAPPELEDASFVVDGTRADGVRFRIVSVDDSDIVLEHPFSLADRNRSLALGCDLDRWLQGLDLGALAPGQDGSVLIDPDHHPDTLAQFVDNLHQSFTLVEDLDGDGLVGDGDTALIPLD